MSVWQGHHPLRGSPPPLPLPVLLAPASNGAVLPSLPPPPLPMPPLVPLYPNWPATQREGQPPSSKAWDEFRFPAVAMASIYNGEDNLQVFPAEVWREEFSSCIPDAVTARFLKSFSFQQIIAIANAFAVLMSRPECRIDAVVEFMNQHCHTAAEVAAINTLLGGERWQQYLPVASYIATGVNYWIRTYSFG